MEQTVSHSGAWGLALIMIVFVSWLFYKYFAPKSWHEWASAGVVQAFIIALYAEMYGFPLTIYILSRLFGLDRGDMDASLWSSLLGLGDTGMMISMIIGYALVFLGIGIFFKGWQQVHKARQHNRLVTDGLYKYVRHPQYTGLFIALFGEGVVHWPTLFSVGLFPFIVLAYYLLARREERKVFEEFGELYRQYQRQVPSMFMPDKNQWREFFQASSSSSDR